MFVVECKVDGVLITRTECVTVHAAREQATAISDSLAYADSITVTNTETGEVEDFM